MVSAPRRATPNLVGRAFSLAYARLPVRGKILGYLVRLEGGEMESATLRHVLGRHHGIDVGRYSYGSLLRPGAADPGLTIGRYVSIGPECRRFAGNHPVDEPGLHPYWYRPAFGYADLDSDIPRFACVIESEAWIGARTLILAGCRRIGFGAVVAAGSVVTADVPDFAVVAGVPATIRRYRLTSEQRDYLLRARPWDQEPRDAITLMKVAAELGGGH